MNAPRRIAVLDLGSNSIKFFVSELHENTLVVLKDQSSITRLGESTEKTGKLSDAAIQRTLEAIAQFKADCASLQISEWRAVATNAVRNANNREEFQQLFKERLRIDLRILTGEEEAELIYKGVTSDRNFIPPKQSLLVIDSGGGSSEFILGNSDRIEKQISLELGCVRVTENFLRGDPYTKDSFEKLLAFYRQQIEPLQKTYSVQGRLLIGTGGSISTAASIIKKSATYESETTHGMILELSQLESLLAKLLEMKNEERVERYHLPVKRADVIVAGVAFFVAVLKMLGANQIRTSLRNLRYGVLFENSSK
jgi:exopolyphosphatase/guanosine-5'-triphosphate,3'-diphosphate pyrophosphatase